MNMIERFGIVAAMSVVTAAAGDSWPTPISIDGNFDDWANVPIAYAMDEVADGLAVKWMKIAHDDQFLFFKFKLTEKVLLTGNNPAWFFVDGDNDSTTGSPVNGIGAEIEWEFRQLSGWFYPGFIQISHPDITLRSAPSVSSDRFEIAIARDTMINDHPLFSGGTVRLAMWVAQSGGIWFPAPGDQIKYTFDDTTPVPTETIPFERESPDDLRIVSYNVWFDGMFDPQREAAFTRILNAIEPDIVHFQEVYQHTAAQTLAYMNEAVPLDNGQWFVAKISDSVTVSKYPISLSLNVQGNLAMLVNTSAKLGKPMFMFNAHLPCCTNNAGRQAQCDAIMQTIRNAMLPGGQITLQEGTPIMISGDLNLVGHAQQLKTLLTGDIVNQSNYGPAFDPDWDGSHLTSVWPRQTEKRMGYTWRNNLSGFQPGHLDYHIYTDSVLDVGRSFTINTQTMSEAKLAKYGLLESDSLVSDHLAFVVDVRPASTSPSIPGDLNGDGIVDVTDLLLLLGAWGSCSGDPCPADLNGDGTVNVADLLILLGNWG